MIEGNGAVADPLERRHAQSDRPRALAESAGRSADELNEVFSHILMSLRLLKEQGSDSSNGKILAEIESDAERGAEIVKQLSALADGATAHRTRLKPNELIDDAVKILGETFPKSIRISANCDPAVKEVEGDDMELHQVLLNLCVNARDAMPNGGSLTLCSRNVTLQEPESCAGLSGPSGEYVQIQVADTGAGMSEELQEKIFHPYFTTKEPGTGCGLGLSTIVRILRSHGALLSLESDPGHGTTFSVYFPAKHSQTERADDAGLTAPVASNNKLVLLVDDEAEICEMCKAILECFDYRVLTAENGMEALALMERHKGDVAAAVVDMMMPIMDGPATIRALRQVAPHVKIIATSGLSIEEQSAVLDTAKPDVYLKKPYSADQLVSTLTNLRL